MSGNRSVESDVDVDLGTLFSNVLRQWRRNLLIALVVTAAAVAVAWTVPAKYRAETRILIETRESVYTRTANSTGAESPVLALEGVASQVELLTSADLLKNVAVKLNLAERPEFEKLSRLGTVGYVLVLLGLKSDPGEIPPEERILKEMRERLNVHLIDKSRVIVVTYSSTNPRLAAEIAKAIAEAYVSLQRDAKLQSNSDATEWLELEIKDLREQVKAAEAKVAAFRAQSDLLVGQGNAPLSTQQLSELSTELSRVRAARSAAEAKAVTVQNGIDKGISPDALPEILSSPLIQRLRERQVQLKADIADLSATLLDNHPRIKSLRSQLGGLDAQIRVEANKLLQALKTEAETARYRERELVADLNKLKVESARAGGQQVELRALEREATAQRELLESYLTRFREAAARGDRNYLPVDARIFAEASVPAEPYFPKIVPIAASAFIGSLLVLVIATLMRELFSGRAMRYSQPSAPMGIAMPVTSHRPPVEIPAETPDAEVPAPTKEPEVAVSGPPEARIQAALRAEKKGMARTPVDPEPGSVPVAEQSEIEKTAADDPEREQAAADQLGELSIEAVADRLISSGATRAIFVSPEGDEAAAASALVARAVSDSGLRVLYLDLTESGAPSRTMVDGVVLPGITNLLASEANFTDVIHSDLYSECDVIPVGTADPVYAMRAIERLPIIMNSLSTAYDLLVVECGPADAEGIERLVAPGSEVMISVIERTDTVIATAAEDLRSRGYHDLLLVTPEGYEPRFPPAGDRTAA